jgi:hypothetical protein
LFLEAALMTESLTTCALAWMTVQLLPTLSRLQAGRTAPTLAAAVGVLGALAIMLRPQFLYLGLLLPLLILYAASGLRWPSCRSAVHAVLVGAPIALSVFSWAKYVEVKTGHFAMSTQSGFGLVNHSVEFIELAPPEYAAVRDILLRYRAQRIAVAGHAGNTVWYAWPEIQRTTGWTLPEASRELQRMSSQMFAEHPARYAASVFRAWLEFWTVPIVWDLHHVEPAAMAVWLDRVWSIEQKLVRVANLVFVVLTATAVASWRVRQALHWDLQVWTIALLVLGSSVMQALADRGAGSRYAMTLQALVVLTVIVVGALTARQFGLLARGSRRQARSG